MNLETKKNTSAIRANMDDDEFDEVNPAEYKYEDLLYAEDIKWNYMDHIFL